MLQWNQLSNGSQWFWKINGQCGYLSLNPLHKYQTSSNYSSRIMIASDIYLKY